MGVLKKKNATFSWSSSYTELRNRLAFRKRKRGASADPKNKENVGWRWRASRAAEASAAPRQEVEACEGRKKSSVRRCIGRVEPCGDYRKKSVRPAGHCTPARGSR